MTHHGGRENMIQPIWQCGLKEDKKMRSSIKTVACVGAGLIGQGWATLFAANGYDVIIQDLSEDRLENATAQVNLNLMFLEKTACSRKARLPWLASVFGPF